MNDQVVGLTVDQRYFVTQRLARGGMATVYLATDTRLDRQVALKIMHPHLAEDGTFRERFYREAKSAASISHPGIVSVFDQGRDGAITYLAMEYVPGCTLREVISEQSPLSLRRTLAITEQVLEAVGAAHSTGLIHRDIKPENVLVGPDHRVKVADFGLARAAAGHGAQTSGVLMGTIAYVAPEVVNEQGADERTDVYAVGVMLYEMLTGSQPFTGDTAITVAYKHVKEDFPLPSHAVAGIPRELDELVLWATAKAPADRPENAWEFLTDLQHIRKQLPAAVLDARPGGALPAVSAPPATQTFEATATRALPTSTFAPLPVDGDPEPQYVPEPARPPRDTGKVWRRLFVGALVIVALAGMTVWYILVGPGAFRDAPSLANLDEQQARDKLSTLGLSADVEYVYDEQAPAGTVLSADPAGGDRVRKGGTIDIVVSQGSAFVAIPDVVGMTKDAANQVLSETDLVLGTVTEEFNENVDEGAIISQSVPAGGQAERSARVDVVISKGREPLTIPNVVSVKAAEARQRLEAAGFSVESSKAFSDDEPAGTVLSQSPSAGETGYRGERVTLTVSAGSEQVKVPDVRFKPTDEAKRILEDAGFVVKIEESLIIFQDQVFEMKPSPGSRVKAGSTVTIKIF